MKDKLLQTFIQDQDMEEDYYSDLNRDSDSRLIENYEEHTMYKIIYFIPRLEGCPTF